MSGHGGERLGVLWHGRYGEAGQGTVWQGWARRGKARFGEAGKARQVGLVRAWLGAVC